MADASWFSRGVVEKLAALRQPGENGKRGGAIGHANFNNLPRGIVMNDACQCSSEVRSDRRA